MTTNFKLPEFHGDVYYKGSAEYFNSLKIWNSDINASPKAVFKPKNARDIQTILQLARSEGVQVTVKNGGHGASGASLNNDGFVIDLDFLKGFELDSEKQSIRIKAGALNYEVARYLAPTDKFFPIGTCPEVGISGLTLGGGIGFLSKKHGLTCDNVLDFTLVTGCGEVIKASHTDNPKLFRALKGAGHCNFGIVTDINYQLHDIPKYVFGGEIAFDIKQCKKVMSHYLELMNGQDDNLYLYCSMNNDVQDKLSIQIYGLYLGDIKVGKKIFDDIKKWAPYYSDTTAVTSYHEMQGSYAEHVPEYPFLKWKSGFINKLNTDGFVDVAVEQYLKRPNENCRCHFDPLGGAVRRAEPNSSAIPFRDSPFIFSILAIWYGKDEREACRQWAYDTHTALNQYFSGNGHANYDDAELSSRADSYFSHYKNELLALKHEYDPDNLLKGVLND